MRQVSTQGCIDKPAISTVGAYIFVVALAFLSGHVKADFLLHDIYSGTDLVGSFVYNDADVIGVFRGQEYFRVGLFQWTSPHTATTYTEVEARYLLGYAPLASPDLSSQTSADTFAGINDFDNFGSAVFFDSITGEDFSITPFGSGSPGPWFEDGFGGGATYSGSYTTSFSADVSEPSALWLFATLTLALFTSRIVGSRNAKSQRKCFFS